MVVSIFENGKWGKTEIKPLTPFSMHPGAKVLHYAQEIFEGLKAFKTSSGKICLFRPQKNITRMTRSAEIMAIPPFPEDVFLDSMKALVSELKDFVPEEPGALYLRPTLIATNTALGVAPSTEYIFYVLASPVGGYFGSLAPGEPASVKVLVTDKYVRAVRGGLGAAKTGANYAASLRAVSEAKKNGFDNVLFLDAIERKYIEELSGMNVFFVEKNKLYTPSLGDTILDGVTRKSLIELAALDNTIQIEEKSLDIHDILNKISQGQITEAFACGTGASVTSIVQFGFKSQNHTVGNGKPGAVTRRLYKALTDIQFGRMAPPNSEWCLECL